MIEDCSKTVVIFETIVHFVLSMFINLISFCILKKSQTGERK